MALSPTHRFGQIIGDLVEVALRDPLTAVAKKHGLYLDYKHPRRVRGGKRKVTWTDHKRSRHDLDYVLEAGGSDTVQGRPRAFIEIAYRRYTKHSRNKAQEMQGAIMPLVEAYRHDHPFCGVVLAGVFTEPSISQMRSHGFGVLYFPFASIVKAFRLVGVDASFDEDSSDKDVQAKVEACGRLTRDQWRRVGMGLRRFHRQELAVFLDELENALTRTIQLVSILALHGQLLQAASVGEAIRAIEAYASLDPQSEFLRFELNVRYTNGDEIRATFQDKPAAIRFLTELS